MHWRLRLADRVVRFRFKRHARRPIDVHWVRKEIGKPLWLRRLATPAVDRAQVVLPSHAVEVLTPPASGASRFAASVQRAVLYVHGGGYIACSPTTHRPLSARIAREWNALTVVPDYRLAPEHPFPCGRDDVLSTWRWMLETLGLNAEQVVFAGDSAGGGIALSAALACAEAGLPSPGAIVVFSPWTDLACTGDSITENAERCAMFLPDQLRSAALLYAGSVPVADPRVSPLNADLSSLPPLCVHASVDELLRDDSLRLMARAREAGVTVSGRTWRGVPHVWQFLASFLPEARESLRLARDFVHEHVPANDLTAVMKRLEQECAGLSIRERETTVPRE